VAAHTIGASGAVRIESEQGAWSGALRAVPPIDDDDNQLMAGVAAMTFAIANSEQMQAQAEQEETGEPEPCGSVSHELRLSAPKSVWGASPTFSSGDFMLSTPRWRSGQVTQGT
jgi:hypothetical protein